MYMYIFPSISVLRYIPFSTAICQITKGPFVFFNGFPQVNLY